MASKVLELLSSEHVKANKYLAQQVSDRDNAKQQVVEAQKNIDSWESYIRELKIAIGTLQATDLGAN